MKDTCEEFPMGNNHTPFNKGATIKIKGLFD